MTCIVSPNTYPTKKTLIEAVKTWNGSSGNRSTVLIHDPSVINPRSFYLHEMLPGEEVAVTNHPKRSWYAQVGRKADGTLYVK